MDWLLRIQSRCSSKASALLVQSATRLHPRKTNHLSLWQRIYGLGMIVLPVVTWAHKLERSSALSLSLCAERCFWVDPFISYSSESVSLNFLIRYPFILIAMIGFRCNVDSLQPMIASAPDS